MGYYSYWDFKNPLTEEQILKLAECSNDLQDCYEGKDCLEHIKDVVNGWIEAKWYSFSEDMQRFSKHYPNDIFTIYQKAEDGERFKFVVKNGTVFRHEVEVKYHLIDPLKVDKKYLVEDKVMIYKGLTDNYEFKFLDEDGEEFIKTDLSNTHQVKEVKK